VRKLLRIAAGVGLMFIGLVGLIMPIMPRLGIHHSGLMILVDYFPLAARLGQT
jgi:hypothetical protein